jgi:hypothetical protein
MRGNPKAVKKKVLRNQKKFLTNPTACGIIRVSRGQEVKEYGVLAR